MTARLARLRVPRLRRARSIALDSAVDAPRPSRLRRIGRFIRPAVETLLAGALVGAAFAVIITELIPPSTSASTESPAARTFMAAVYQKDADAQDALLIDGPPASRALLLQRIATVVLSGTPTSLTYLGGSTAGGVAVDMYALEITLPDGSHRLVPFRLLSSGGRVLAHVVGEVPGASPAS
jgi:hypothetical protein